MILLNLRNQEIEAALEAGYEKQSDTLRYLRVLAKHIKCGLETSTEFSIFCIWFLKKPPRKYLLITVGIEIIGYLREQFEGPSGNLKVLGKEPALQSAKQHEEGLSVFFQDLTII